MMKNTIISRFKSAIDNSPIDTSLEIELNSIKEGVYSEQIDSCRNALRTGNIQLYKNLKKQLPAVTFAGRFISTRSKDTCDKYAKLIVLDFDGIEDISMAKNLIQNDKYTYAVWTSPSGRGIKVLIKINADATTHKYCFDSLSEYYSETYRMETDKSGSDITRLCFTSFDPELYLNSQSEVWTTQKISQRSSGQSFDRLDAKSRNTSLSAKDNVNPRITEKKNDSRCRTLVKRIIKYFARQNKSITGIYQDWLIVAFAIATTFTPDIGIKHFLELCRLDKENHNEEQSLDLIEFCYRNNRGEVTFASIVYLATKAGFKSNP